MPPREEQPAEFFVDRSLGKGIVEGLRTAGLTVHSMADIYGENPGQLLPDEVWLRDAGKNNEAQVELLTVLDRLSGVLKARAAHDWLFSPNPMLDDFKPVDLLRKGEYRKVLGAIDAMAEGVFV